jgi:hypothetical protein
MHLLPEGFVAQCSEVVHAQQTMAMRAALLLLASFAALPAFPSSEKTTNPQQKWTSRHHVHILTRFCMMQLALSRFKTESKLNSLRVSTSQDHL